MSEPETGPEGHVSSFHLHVSGSIAASLVPWWLHWNRSAFPAMTVNVSVSRQATTFASLKALDELAGGSVWLDAWDAPGVPDDWRDGRSGAAEAIMVFPATLDTTMRLAQGRADSPALMLLQGTTLPVVMCDNFPFRNTVIEHFEGVLRQRSNIHYAPRVRAIRASDRTEVETGLNFPGALDMMRSLAGY